jgi:hypothetical protein
LLTPRATENRRDGALIWLAALHGAILLAWPLAPVIGIGVWWNSNTIAHNFIHRPFFRSRRFNALFSAYLSVLVGIPQVLWRERHLAHHARIRWRLRVSPQLVAEVSLVAGLWTLLAVLDPHFFLTVYFPGYLAGLGLCALQGYYEHASGAISHYGFLYNALCFNDGYHAEHHAFPGAHWSELPSRVQAGPRVSRWPALLRWLDHPLVPFQLFPPISSARGVSKPMSFRQGSAWAKQVGTALEAMERVVVRSSRLQRLVLAGHRQAFARLVPALPPVSRVLIVGGGLFPRTALILRELLPCARIDIMDASACNLELAQSFLDAEFITRHYVPEESNYDLVVIPLSFDGSHEAIYRNPPAPAVMVHDWIWRRRGTSRIVSVLLLKRLNLITA